MSELQLESSTKSLKLEHIIAPVKEELVTFNKAYKKTLNSEVPLMSTILKYVVKSKGKQIRPTITLLFAKLFGQTNESSINAATLSEILHTATLVHDDVVDESIERRGMFSIKALWKNKAAVLVGDFMLSRGFLLALDHEEYNLLQIFSKAVKQMAEGELLQLKKARRLDINEQVYFDVIRQKTASMIAACCTAGAASIIKDKKTEEDIWTLGEKIGMCFQIKDDLLDYNGKDSGKPKGNDIKEKKMTLPLIYALSQAGFFEKRKIIHAIKNRSEQTATRKLVMDFVDEKEGIEYAKKAMLKLKTEAIEMLHVYPRNEARDAIEMLIHFITTRTK